MRVASSSLVKSADVEGRKESRKEGRKEGAKISFANAHLLLHVLSLCCSSEGRERERKRKRRVGKCNDI